MMQHICKHCGKPSGYSGPALIGQCNNCGKDAANKAADPETVSLHAIYCDCERCTEVRAQRKAQNGQASH